MKTQKHNAKELEYAKLYCRRAYFKGVKVAALYAEARRCFSMRQCAS
ncbi:hypothetical protein [Enterovibrio nigricans]|uniref:Uncharacterized protein n=1 Tax=Enterovibrio nigricans DSM 22720 TaxID=1121868 RepID=A0A1T4UR94_9GAMM|nr:hypothetical protein [Enterovibrio nigricans]SKA55165.1 hypothetical protein SAMN02745132_02288 [Enterovibrio nigricans DSM 22720]